MAIPFLDLKAQYASLATELDGAIARVVQSQHFILGPEVERFEVALAERLRARHAIGVASGTDALLLALRALNLPAGSGVVVPAFTFFATAGAVWNAGLRPVFADVDEDTFNLTADDIEAVLTPDTRAIVVVHLYGLMAPMAPIMDLARTRGLSVIEDVAQAMGSRQSHGGAMRDSGSIGDFGAYSFFPTKVLGAFGDAGAVTAQDDELAERVRKLRVHGGRQMYHHEMVGTNSRLDALQAAVLSAKLPLVDAWIEARRAAARRYDELLAGVAEVRTPRVPSGDEHVFGVYTIRAERRDALREHLAARGIGSSIYYPVPLHLQECFAELGGRAGDLPVSESLAQEVLSLPIYPEMPQADVAGVTAAIREFYGRS